MKLFVLVLIIITLCSCSSKKYPVAPEPECERLYTILPDNYVIELAAGATVTLNPDAQEFPLYCSPEDARKALGDIFGPEDGSRWQVYHVEGTSGDIAQRLGNRQYRLKQPARVLDWVQPGPAD